MVGENFEINIHITQLMEANVGIHGKRGLVLVFDRSA